MIEWRVVGLMKGISQGQQDSFPNHKSLLLSPLTLTVTAMIFVCPGLWLPLQNRSTVPPSPESRNCSRAANPQTQLPGSKSVCSESPLPLASVNTGLRMLPWGWGQGFHGSRGKSTFPLGITECEKYKVEVVSSPLIHCRESLSAW